MTEQTELTLNNGLSIPQLGFGVYMIQGDRATKEATKIALSDGYRHIDTAHAYQNERGVGAAVKESGLARGDVWITSKLWPSEYGEGITSKAIGKMLKRLDTDYIDLLLLHQQFGDYLGAWKDMEKAVEDGRVKSIGISNFDGERLEELVAHATIKPAVIQVESHPYYPQEELRNKMAKYGTKIEAWYPLGHGDNTLLNESVFKEIGEKYQKSSVQVILRWHIQVGNIVLPKSENPDHIQSNFEIFDFELTQKDMEKIAQLDKNKRYFTMSLEDQETAFQSFVPAD